jgi:hypothetical protein
MSKAKGGITLHDFVAHLPEPKNYIFLPTRSPWSAESVDTQFPDRIALLDENGKPVLRKDKKGKDVPVTISASEWLDINRPVHQMTWAPGMDMMIKDRVVADGGWINKPGADCFNLYRPPRLKPKRGKVKPWLDHIRKIYPKDAGHIIKWLAHRVQHPAEKINHALMLGGAQGIGKDTLLEPIKYAVGPWNFAEISPTHLVGDFNGFAKSVVLRISEARDLGESNRYAAYDHSKTYMAAPPDTLRVNEKFLREYYIFNCCGVIVTTNYKTDGIYLPADDRRHYVAWSDAKKENFKPAYWKKLWGWYLKGGYEAIAFYLAKLDISSFDAKAPPPKTDAFWAIVEANRAPEEAELADVFEQLGNPNAVTLAVVKSKANEELREWLDDKKNRRAIPHRLENVHYSAIPNKDATSGLWRVDHVKYVGKHNATIRTKEDYVIESDRMMIYAKSTLSPRDQLAAVQELRRKATVAAKEHIESKVNGKARGGFGG